MIVEMIKNQKRKKGNSIDAQAFTLGKNEVLARCLFLD